MLRLIIITFSLIATIAVNRVANIVPFNGSTTEEIANRLPILFTPASYVFFIWPVICLLLVIWLVGFWKYRENTNSHLQNRRVFLFALSSLFNIAWTLLWHYEYFNWTIAVMVALLATLLALYFTYSKSENRFFERIPIAVYLAWVLVTFITNVSYVLTLHEWDGWGLSSPLWTVIYLTLATAIALHFLYHYKDVAFNLVFVWTFIGIAVKNGFDELFISVAALFLAAAITVCMFLFKKDPLTNN